MLLLFEVHKLAFFKRKTIKFGPISSNISKIFFHLDDFDSVDLLYYLLPIGSRRSSVVKHWVGLNRGREFKPS